MCPTSLSGRLEGSSLHLTLLQDADAYVAQRISCQLLATNEVKRQAKRMGQMCPTREYSDFVLVVTVTWPYGIRCGLKTAKHMAHTICCVEYKKKRKNFALTR